MKSIKSYINESKMSNLLDKGLEAFVNYRYEEGNYKDKEDWKWDEAMIWAIQDYYSSRGEFSAADKKFLKKNKLSEEDFTDED